MNFVSKTRLRASVGWCLLVLGLSGAGFAAQKPSSESALPSVKELEAEIAEIKANEKLEPALQAALLKQYSAALDAVKQIDQARKQTAQFKQDVSSAAERARALQRDIEAATQDLKMIQDYRVALGEWHRIEKALKQAEDAPESPDATQPSPEALEIARTKVEQLRAKLDFPPLVGKSPEELEALQSARKAEVAVLEQQVQQIEAADKQRTARRAEIAATQSKAKTRLAKLRQRQDGAAPEGESPRLTAARKLAARLQTEALRASQTSDDFELAKYEAEEAVALLDKSETLLREQLEKKKEVVALIENQLRRLREAEARSLGKKTASQMESLQAGPLAAEAAINAEYAKALSEFPADPDLPKIEVIQSETKQTDQRLDRQVARFRDIQEKEELVGLTQSIGLLLRSQRRTLPDPSEIARRIASRVKSMETVLQNSWTYEQSLANLPNASQLVNDALRSRRAPTGQTAGLDEADRQILLQQAESLLETRRKLLTELFQRSQEYLRALTDLDSVSRKLLENTRDYSRYINERIFWTRSAELLTPARIWAQTDTWGWMFSPANWWDVLKGLIAGATERPWRFWPALVGIAILSLSRLRFRYRIQALGKQAARRGVMDYEPTAKAAILTFASAAIVPAILAFLAWQLFIPTGPNGFRLAVAEGLSACAVVLFPIALLRVACRHWGLAEAHFNWPPRTISHLRHGLWWLRTLAIPLALFGTMAHHHDPRAGSTAPERLLFIASMIVVSLTFAWLLRGGGQLSRSMKAERPKGYYARGQRLWHFLAVATPLALAGLSVDGYHHSAVQLFFQLLWTMWLAVLVFLARSLVVRWIVLSRRRLLLDQAYQRREAAAGEESQESAAALTPPIVEETDVVRSTAQTRRFLDLFVWSVALAGLWIIWSPTFPAATGALNNPVHLLWSGDEQIPVVKTDTDASPDQKPATADADPVEETSEPSAADPIVGLTWLELVQAILVALFTFVAARNLPGLLEVSVLRRLPMDNAAQYTATRLTVYTIVIVGLAFVALSLGLKWDNVQWLVAALSVGLGFGLQEIVANFVSGLIVLFERPIRVGDTVTIGNVMGVVSRIRMRATTITNWDRQEFIVPNKDLITGQLLNWTLSNDTTRMTIVVAVPHGSDTQTARDLLLRAAAEHPLVLGDPAPIATFDGFDNGKFNLTLRVYFEGLDPWYDVVHDVHTRIVALFHEAGISVAIPPQDLHIRSLPPHWPADANHPTSRGDDPPN